MYYHGKINIEYDSLFLKILDQADMQIDKYGNDVGYEKRLLDIKNRYGEESDVYMECRELIRRIK